MRRFLGGRLHPRVAYATRDCKTQAEDGLRAAELHPHVAYGTWDCKMWGWDRRFPPELHPHVAHATWDCKSSGSLRLRCLFGLLCLLCRGWGRYGAGYGLFCLLGGVGVCLGACRPRCSAFVGRVAADGWEGVGSAASDEPRRLDWRHCAQGADFDPDRCRNGCGCGRGFVGVVSGFGVDGAGSSRVWMGGVGAFADIGWRSAAASA